MEKIWQHAHFLIYNNDKSNIHELRTAENVDQKMAMSLTSCWSKEEDVMRQPVTKCAI